MEPDDVRGVVALLFQDVASRDVLLGHRYAGLLLDQTTAEVGGVFFDSIAIDLESLES